MNQARSRKVRFTARLILARHEDAIKAACENKFAMKNRFGKPQHLRINPRRQVKKMVLREKIA